MLVELSANAQTDLEAIEHYIAALGHTPNPEAARKTVTKILRTIEILRIFPRFGKPGRVEGTHELDVPSAPYYVIYRFISNRHIVVTTIIHDRRQYPPQANQGGSVQ